MRKLVLLALALPVLAHAQNDYLANDPVWTATSVCNEGGFGGSCLTNDHYSYRTAGDTLIGTVAYTKVVRYGTRIYSWVGGNPPPPPICTGGSAYGPALAGLIRQEASAFYLWDGYDDQLLFDFDLNVGDTLPLSFNNWNTDLVVDALDSIQVGSEWRKRFIISNVPIEVIEGIGSSNGLFEPVANFFDCGYQLECFGLDTIGYYPGTGPDCSIAMGINAVSLDQSQFEVSPNPVNDVLRISGVDPQHTGFVRLFDVQGCERLHGALYRENMTLDMSAIPGGVYVLVVGDQRQQVVVTH